MNHLFIPPNRRQQQQAQLVAGLQELYSRLQSGRALPGEMLPEARCGYPYVYEILEQLNLLPPSSGGSGLEECYNRMQPGLLERSTPYNSRRGSIDPSLTPESTTPGPISNGDTPISRSMSYDHACTQNHSVRILPINSPLQQSDAAPPVKHEADIVLSTMMYTEPTIMDESPSLNGKPIYAPNTYDHFDAMTLDPCMVSPIGLVTRWNDLNYLDFSSLYNFCELLSNSNACGWSHFRVE